MAKFDMYAEVTARIIKMLEAGEIPWEKPWVGSNGAWSREDGKYYCLINQLLLPPGEYATRERIFKDGGKILKGSKQKQVWSFYFKRVEETDETTGEIEVKFLPRQKYIGVFNVATDTDLEPKYHTETVETPAEPLTVLEAVKNDYLERSGVLYNETYSSSAYYSPAADQVTVPSKAQFEETAEYYSTVFHELAHSTGHESRLKRFDCSLGVAAFGSEDYSREELVAELTSCAVLSYMGVSTRSSFRNNAAYIGAWVAKLKEDNKAIIRAAAKAERAYNLIMGIEENFDGDSNETTDK